MNVPYRGSLFPNLLAGQGLFRGDSAPARPFRTGKLRAPAVTTTSRIAVLPEVPAMDEFLLDYEASGWLGIGRPKSTPPATIDRLAKELAAFQTEPGMKTRLSQFWRGAATHDA